MTTSLPFFNQRPVGTGLPDATHSRVYGLPSGAHMDAAMRFSHSGLAPPASSPVRTGVVQLDGSDLPVGFMVIK